MEIKEWLIKYKNWFIYPIVILFFFWVSSIMKSNKTPETTQVENVSEEIIKEEVSEWTLIDEKDRFEEPTGKKIMVYKTQGKLENKYDHKINFLIKKKRIGILEFYTDGRPTSFMRGRFDMKNSENEKLTVGIIDSWERGKGVGIIKYSFDGNSSQYDKILKFLLKSKGDIKVVLTQTGESTVFTINTNGFEELYNSSKDILSSGGEEQD